MELGYEAWFGWYKDDTKWIKIKGLVNNKLNERNSKINIEYDNSSDMT